MAQTTFTSAREKLTEGQIVQARNLADINTFGLADPSLGFGRFCYTSNGACRVVRSNVATLTIGSDLGASNVLAGNITVIAPDGTSVTTAYTETYASSNAATMGALVAELDAIDNITAALGADGSGNANRRITVTAAAGYSVYFASGSVTGGSAVTVTLANTFSGAVYGPSVAAERDPDSSGVVDFEQYDDVGLMRKGYIAIPVDGTISPGDTPYIRIVEEAGTNKKLGMLTTAAGTGPVKAIDASSLLTIERGVTGAGLAVVAVNRP